MKSEMLPEISVTKHVLRLGNARDLSFIKDESVHLVITSPPYWNLKRYNEHPEQFGHIRDYEDFLIQIEEVWREAYRILAPGGSFGLCGRRCLSFTQRKWTSCCRPPPRGYMRSMPQNRI
jgi:tRNA1(Val) A37 N6-methylase TrmN6